MARFLTLTTVTRCEPPSEIPSLGTERGSKQSNRYTNPSQPPQASKKCSSWELQVPLPTH